MPTYEYLCECGNRLERVSPMNNIKQRVKCTCGKWAKKVFSLPNKKVIFRDAIRNPSPRQHRGRGY